MTNTDANSLTWLIGFLTVLVLISVSRMVIECKSSKNPLKRVLEVMSLTLMPGDPVENIIQGYQAAIRESDSAARAVIAARIERDDALVKVSTLERIIKDAITNR